MKKTYHILLNSISFIIFILAVFHIAFWKIFEWNTTLACLSSDNRNIMYALNIISVMNFFAMIIISLFFKKDLLETKLGKFILGWFGSFWFLRVILEFILWNENPDLFVIVICFLLGAVYVLPFIAKIQDGKEKK